MRGWTLSDVGTRAGATGTTEGDVTLPATAPYLASVPQGTYVVVVLTVPTGNANTLAEDLTTADGDRRLVLVAGTTTGVVTAGALDLSTNENLQLYAGTRASGVLIDQVLMGSNTSLIDGAAWGDNSSATTTDNVNGGSSIPSNGVVRFVPSADTLAEFQNNDTGARFDVDTTSYGSPGERNAGVSGDTAIGGSASSPPAGTGGANPSSAEPGQTTLLTVTVTPGTSPASTGITVSGNLTSIGGAASAEPQASDPRAASQPLASVHCQSAAACDHAGSVTYLLHPIHDVLAVGSIVVRVGALLKLGDDFPDEGLLLLVSLEILCRGLVLVLLQPVGELVVELLHGLVEDLLVGELLHHAHEHLGELLLAALGVEVARGHLLEHLGHEVVAATGGGRCGSLVARVSHALHGLADGFLEGSVGSTGVRRGFVGARGAICGRSRCRVLCGRGRGHLLEHFLKLILHLGLWQGQRRTPVYDAGSPYRFFQLSE